MLANGTSEGIAIIDLQLLGRIFPSQFGLRSGGSSIVFQERHTTVSLVLASPCLCNYFVHSYLGLMIWMMQ